MGIDAERAFFSYSREDSDFALRLAADLKAAGAVVWLDQLNINPGQRWDRAVEDALTTSPIMLVILSPSSVSSTTVQDEVAFALEKQKTLIPLLYRDCAVPFRLRRFQYVEFRQDYDRGLKQLIKALGVEQQDGRPDMFMNKTQDMQQQLIAELGLNTLPTEKQTEMLTELFLKKLYVETAERLGKEQMNMYESYAETHTPEESAAWLVKHIPDYEAWTEKLRDEFIAELKKGME